MNRYKRQCICCRERYAIYAMQHFYTNTGKPFTTRNVQIATRPIICEKCIFDDNYWPRPIVFASDADECKKLVVKFASYPYDEQPMLLFGNKRAIKYVTNITKT